MQELPEGWAAAELGEVADIQLGKMLDREKRKRGKPLPYLRNANVRWGGFALDDLLEMPFEEHELEKYSLQVGDLIVCEGGEPGRAAIWSSPDSRIKFQKALLRIRPKGGIDPRWVLFALRRSALSGELESYFTGSTIKHFPRQAVLHFSLPLPPLAEQKRIVEKVEALLAQVQAARDRLERVQQILKRFRQAVLAAAFDGRLTAGWRELGPTSATGSELRDTLGAMAPLPEDALELDLPESWCWAKTETLCDPARPITYGVIKLGPSVDDGVPTLRSSDVRQLRIEHDNVKVIDREIANQYTRTFLRGGEVVVTVRGTLGGVAVVPDEMNGFNISREVALLPFKTPLSPQFFAMAIASKRAENWLLDRSKGAAYTGINISDLRRLPLPLPPLAEQLEVVKRATVLLRLADEVDRRVDAVSRQVAFAPQAILKRAFAGELVQTEPQVAEAAGRAFESGAELLERVRGSRSSATVGRAAGQKRKARKGA